MKHVLLLTGTLTLTALPASQLEMASTPGARHALAAQAAFPLSAAAATGDPVVLGNPNVADAATSITNTTSGGTAVVANGAGTGYGVEADSSGGAGTFSWSISPPSWWDPASDGPYTGVFGWSPAHPAAPSCRRSR